jgi:hypothetical protein
MIDITTSRRIFSQNNDLAAKMPDKLRDMKELFLVQATKYNVDTRMVDDNDYQPPFRFTGKLAKLTIKLFPLKAAGKQHLQQQIQNARNTAQ